MNIIINESFEYLPVSHMFVDICSSTCLVAANLAGMIFNFKVNTFYVLS